MDAEDVVVDRKHVHGGGGRRRWDGDRDLSIVNTTEITGPGWLMFFWLEREGVRVHTRVWVTGVVLEWLNLVKVLTVLLLESVLTVENQLEGRQWTNEVFVELRSGVQEQLWGAGPYPPRTIIEVDRLNQDDIVEVEGTFYAPVKK